jgi:hypothetical protein
MKRAICVFAFGLILLGAATAASAQSSFPVIEGGVQGLELCPQDWCGAAVFSGLFHGRIGINPNAVGIVTAAIRHTDLPTEINDFALITGGGWELRTLTRRITGAVLAGRITYIGNNFFEIRILMDLRSGGGGYVVFGGILDHNTLIPNFAGNLLQIP